MGFCFSKPVVDDGDNENTALLDEPTVTAHTPPVPDRFANLSPEEVTRIKEEERLKMLEQKTTDALINISSHRADFMHTQPFGGGGGGGSRDYAELLHRFNQQIKLPMTTLSGPAEIARNEASGVDVVGILSDPYIPESNIKLVDDTINKVIDVISDIYIDPPPGDCIVSLSFKSGEAE
ncbi:hypothetical protein GGI25_005306 [Coemansia spiralis]|uniref:Uncharacterized protein n=2 Tax=Coemansia TaxID=4863 RepID=A0A9W8FYT8_9FUNG|nr:hypothetical protein BX070DRAFT_243089 [Coemansia spiralis]KAJ1990345.1 hypothetical protein EDC05_004109 [Coemansia umbellata]KAJ2620738.1 hypothetical protein GGI26_004726 [Coemansia sp. RSA 1358]KAJ2671917.1 hypothetical protein GGI25_005306 [Coemansia spiralis]